MQLRNISTIALAGAIGVVALAGTADATVHYLALGGSNTTTTTTTLYDKYGTPLSLKGPSTKPPLSVSNKVQVPNLNASYLGGLTKSAFVTPAQAQAIANAAAAKAATAMQTKILRVAAPMSKGAGIVRCPTGWHPTGGGVLPLTVQGDVLPYVAFSTAAVENGVVDGWIGAAVGDANYPGGGFIWATCTNAIDVTPTPSPSPSTSTSASAAPTTSSTP